MASQQSNPPTSQQSSNWNRKASSWFEKLGRPVNKLSNKLGAEAFWPTSLDQEADKAARILRSFCIDGFMAEQGSKKEKRLDHIPPEVDILP